MTDKIRLVGPDRAAPSGYRKALSDCIVLTHDRKILLQQRPLDRDGRLCAFGGHLEQGETSMQALIRELREELGAIVRAEDVVAVGAITEDFTGHTEIIYTHFWHDRNGTVSGCYEYEAVTYDDVAEALKHPRAMDYLVWLLKECRRRELIP